MENRVHIEIYGRVQGVGFRQATLEVAQRLSLIGWVQNDSTRNRVIAEAQGAPRQLKQLEEWLKTGPALAHVDHLNVDAIPAIPESAGFEILRTPSK